MGKGKLYKSEKMEYKDAETGKRITRLTGSSANDHHLYFTNSSFTPDGNTLIFVSERTGRVNIFRMDIESGKICQLTDGEEIYRFSPCLARSIRKVFYIDGLRVKSTDIHTLGENDILTLPPKSEPHIITISGDDDLIAFAYRKNIQFPAEGRAIEVFKLKSECAIIVAKTDGSKSWNVIEERNWISHTQFSPTDKNLILYCHEGKWEDVEQRMWLISTHGTGKRPLRIQKPEDALGHEYWTQDGKKVIYHGWTSKERKHILGSINPNGTGCVEISTPVCTHFCSNSDNSLIVGDGDRGKGDKRDDLFIYLLKVEGASINRWRIARHGTSWKGQITHPHPIFSPDDKKVLFTSDVEGTCNVYLVEMES